MVSKPKGMTFKERILAAMTAKSWDTRSRAAPTLREKWIEHAHKNGIQAPTPTRPVFYEWLKSDTPKIDVANLFVLSDVLGVNARWLCGLTDTPFKPVTPDPDLQVLIDAWNNISPTAREELVTEANKLLRVHAAATKAQPFTGHHKAKP